MALYNEFGVSCHSVYLKKFFEEPSDMGILAIKGHYINLVFQNIPIPMAAGFIFLN